MIKNSSRVSPRSQAKNRSQLCFFYMYIKKKEETFMNEKRINYFHKPQTKKKKKTIPC